MVNMSTIELLDAKFAEVDELFAQAMANGEIKRGVFGCSLGDYFIGNDGSVVHHINNKAMLRALAGEREKELQEQIEYHRIELAKAEDTLYHLKQLQP